MQIDTVLIKVASRCNINCSYCYVYHMGDSNWARIAKLVSPETMDNMVSSLKSLIEKQERKFSTVLHGGEPLMLGAPALRDFFAKLRTVLSNSYPISIQTNGTLLSNEILDICSKYRVSIAVSLDGPAKINDRVRLDHQNQSTFDRVINGINLLKANPDAEFLYAGLLAVIDPLSDPVEVYEFFKNIKAPSVDFLYRDGNHSSLPQGKQSVDSTEYGKWIVRLLDLYLNDATPIPIRFLDDMLKLLIGGDSTKEGIGLSDFSILIFDTDGAITKNDTLKSSFEGADRFESNWRTGDIPLTNLLESEEYKKYHNLQKPTSPSCFKCPELKICGGGMTVHRWKDETGYDNPTIYCADQLFIINHMRKHLKNIGLAA